MSGFLVDSRTLLAVRDTLGRLHDQLVSMHSVIYSYWGVLGGRELEGELEHFCGTWHYGVTAIADEIADLMTRLTQAAAAYERIEQRIAAAGQGSGSGSGTTVIGGGSGSGTTVIGGGSPPRHRAGSQSGSGTTVIGGGPVTTTSTGSGSGSGTGTTTVDDRHARADRLTTTGAVGLDAELTVSGA
jgi:hypothetical protein